MFDASTIRNDFPQLERKINGKPLIYLDSTATSLKPKSVLGKLDEYYTQYSANIHRGIYSISEVATEEYEGVRQKVATLIHAPDASEIIFTRNTTESINLVYYSWGLSHIGADDAIVVTIMEHHSNIVPWQELAREKGATLHIWDIEKDGELDLNRLDKLITRKTKLLAITAASNVLGTINPLQDIISRVKRQNPKCIVLVDAAQAVPHMPVDIRAWGADFVAFSGHKMLGPTGVGVLWGRMELLDAMEPFLYGGEMISRVYRDKAIFKTPPHKFEAGTPHIAGVIGLGAAVDYLTRLGMAEVRRHEKEITSYALSQLAGVSGVRLFGPRDPENKGGVIAFTMNGIHAHDIAQVLDQDNICIRSGHHCTMPLHDYLKIPASARASFYVYTTKEDIDALVQGLEKVKQLFR